MLYAEWKSSFRDGVVWRGYAVSGARNFCEKSYLKGEVAVCLIIERKASSRRVRNESLCAGDRYTVGMSCKRSNVRRFGLNESDSLDGSLIRRIDL